MKPGIIGAGNLGTADHRLRVDTISSNPKRVLIVVANPATADTVGWRVGFWGVDLDDYDAIMVAGGLAPMFSFRDDEQLHDALRRFYDAEKPTCSYVQGGLCKAFVARDGRLVTGQQRYCGRKVAQRLIEVLGL